MSNRKPTNKSQVLSKLPRYMPLSAAQYHADRSAIGRSALWTFHESRRQYEAEYVIGDAPARKKSKPMDLGTLCHFGLLEPEKFPTQYAVFPAKVLALKDGSESPDGAESTIAAKAFRRENEAAGKVVLKEKEFSIVKQVVEAVRWKLDELGWLDVPSRREQAIFWTNPQTGLPCKALIDWIIPARDRVFVIDFKSAREADPDSFRRSCEDYGYFLQDPHYSEGVSLVTGLPVEFLFVVAETEFPHRTSIDRFKDQTRKECADARLRYLSELQSCQRSGDFSEPWENTVNELSLRPSCYA